MKKEKILTELIVATLLLAAFFALIGLLLTVDVQGIGPNGAEVGLAGINGAFSNFIGYNLTLYKITEYAGYAGILSAVAFAFLGLCQLIKRRSFYKVDVDLYVLASFYIVSLIFYIAFMFLKINLRPVSIDDVNEASFPSSHTFLTIGISTTAIMQIKNRVKNMPARVILTAVISSLSVFVIVGRILSGVHWLTDIIGGLILVSSLVLYYDAAITAVKQ